MLGSEDPYLILSHPDADHINLLHYIFKSRDEAVGKINPRAVYLGGRLNGYNLPRKIPDLITYWREKGIPLHVENNRQGSIAKGELFTISGSKADLVVHARAVNEGDRSESANAREFKDSIPSITMSLIDRAALLPCG